MFSGKRTFRWLLAGLILVFLAMGAAYAYITSGGLIAMQKPSATETFLAGWLLRLSLPKSAKKQKSLLLADSHSQDLAAGVELYKKDCEVCHGADGGGTTPTGVGLYPPPLDLGTPGIQKTPDGVLFYFIRNGIRNTAMPGWKMPDQDIWRLVLVIRNLPQVAAPPNQSASVRNQVKSAHYVGSEACKSCHNSTYERWKKTLMANVVRDPREHPEAIIPDLSKPDPLLTFTKDDIAFVYGSKWKQRYFKKVGDDYFPLPAQWDVSHKMWRAYNVKPGTDWWTPFYPTDNMHRPTGPTCDGCHSVFYDVNTKKVTEWNVGCEKCHGPGSDHVRKPTTANIINPSRMNYIDATDTCVQCHSQGRPVSLQPAQGKAYDWPVGFEMGKRLSDYWRLEDHRLGATTFTHFADGTAHKNRMQGNDFVASLMYTHGVTCFTCHDAHGSGNVALLRKPPNALCLDCHGPNSSNGPREASIEEHTHHKAGSQGSECIACHMPKIQQTIADVNVRSHTFHFVTPAASESLKIPNASNVCHADKSTAWSTAALKSWSDRSPWRMAE